MTEDKRIFLDVDAINKRAGSNDWHFSLDGTGKLVVVFRKRNVIDIADAANFRTAIPPAGPA